MCVKDVGVAWVAVRPLQSPPRAGASAIKGVDTCAQGVEACAHVSLYRKMKGLMLQCTIHVVGTEAQQRHASINEPVPDN